MRWKSHVIFLSNLQLNCYFKIKSLCFSWDYGYACQVSSVNCTSLHDCEVMSVTGKHEYGKSNHDVVYFYSNDKDFICFPKNLEVFFKNLDKISFSSTNISAITNSDLQPFGNRLKVLYFYYNKVEVIPADLFVNTRNLEEIYLQDNQIKHVEKGAFDKLHNLSTLYFKNNPCNSGVATNRSDVLNLVIQIESKCTHDEAFQNYKDQLTTTASTTERYFADELSICNRKMSNQELEIEKLKAELEAEKEKNSIINSENEKCQQENYKNINFERKFSDFLLEVDAKNTAVILELASKTKSSCDGQNLELKNLGETLLQKFVELEAKLATTDAKLNVLNGK